MRAADSPRSSRGIYAQRALPLARRSTPLERVSCRSPTRMSAYSAWRRIVNPKPDARMAFSVGRCTRRLCSTRCDSARRKLAYTTCLTPAACAASSAVPTLREPTTSDDAGASASTLRMTARANCPFAPDTKIIADQRCWFERTRGFLCDTMHSILRGHELSPDTTSSGRSEGPLIAAPVAWRATRARMLRTIAVVPQAYAPLSPRSLAVSISIGSQGTRSLLARANLLYGTRGARG